MGKPTGHRPVPLETGERTQGSETSQYLEEQKAIRGLSFWTDAFASERSSIHVGRESAITFRKKVLAIP